MLNMTHHARLIESDSFSEYTPDQTGYEVIYLDHDRVGIPEVAMVAQLATRMPVNAPRKLLVLRTTQVTVEAQNALLKLFEEPPATTDFVLAVPVGLSLLPTMLSRMERSLESSSGTNAGWQEFLNASVPERFKQIEQWQKQKDTAWLLAMQTGLRSWVTTIEKPNRTLQLVADRLHTRGASNKMLLEALALDSQLQKR